MFLICELGSHEEVELGLLAYLADGFVRGRVWLNP